MARRNTNFAPAHVIGLGCGGVDELRARLSDSSVAWGLLRFEVGEGAFARVKFVAVHVNGDDAPTVTRGRQNARTAEMMKQLGDVHAMIEVKRAEDLTLDTVLDKLLPLMVADEGLKVSVSAMKEAYEQRIVHLKRNSRRLSQGINMITLKEKVELIGKSLASRRAEMLTSVSGQSGRCNWLLLEAPGLELFNAGCGGLPEMTQWLHDDKVLFGLIRFTFVRSMAGTSTLATVKHVFIRSIGANVPPVARGHLTAKWRDAEIVLKTECSAAFVKECDSPDALDLAELIAELKRLCEIDTEHGERQNISVPAYLASLEEETADALEEECGAENIEVPMPDIETAVKRLRAKDSSWNWALLTLQRQEQAATTQAQTSASLEESVPVENASGDTTAGVKHVAQEESALLEVQNAATTDELQ